MVLVTKSDLFFYVFFINTNYFITLDEIKISKV